MRAFNYRQEEVEIMKTLTIILLATIGMSCTSFYLMFICVALVVLLTLKEFTNGKRN